MSRFNRLKTLAGRALLGATILTSPLIPGCSKDNTTKPEQTTTQEGVYSGFTNNEGIIEFEDGSKYRTKDKEGNIVKNVEVKYLDGNGHNIAVFKKDNYFPKIDFNQDNKNKGLEDIILQIIQQGINFVSETYTDGDEALEAFKDYISFRLGGLDEPTFLGSYNGTYSSNEISDYFGTNLNIALFTASSLIGGELSTTLQIINTIEEFVDLEEILETPLKGHNYDKYSSTFSWINFFDIFTLMQSNGPELRQPESFTEVQSGENPVIEFAASDEKKYLGFIPDPTFKFLGNTDKPEIRIIYDIKKDGETYLENITTQLENILEEDNNFILLSQHFNFNSFPDGRYQIIVNEITDDTNNKIGPTNSFVINVGDINEDPEGWITFFYENGLGKKVFKIKPDGSEKQEIGTGNYPALNPDGSKIAYNKGNKIYISDSNGENEQLIVEDGAAPTWSPDGKYLAYHLDLNRINYAICKVKLEDSKIDTLTSGDLIDKYPDWGPNGNIVCTSVGLGGMAIIDDEGELIQRINTFNPATDPSWSPDGKYIAYASRYSNGWSKTLWKFNIETLETELLPPYIDSTSLSHPTWSPDGKYIAFTAGSYQGIRVINLNTEEEYTIPSSYNNESSGPYCPSWK